MRAVWRDSSRSRALWTAAMGENPSRFGPEGDWESFFSADSHEPSLLQPVERVSWDDCSRQLDRMVLSLPSEAQWECGTRAGTETPWWTGLEMGTLQGAANLLDEYAHAVGNEHQIVVTAYEGELYDGFWAPAPVGSYAANPFGLHDVHGNLGEWCLDVYGPYRAVAGSDPVAASDARIIRGGAFMYAPAWSRSAARYGYAPGFNGEFLGVRPARAITE